MTRPDGNQYVFPVKICLENQVEIGYYQNGGILQTVVKEMLTK
jgi:aconitase A